MPAVVRLILLWGVFSLLSFAPGVTRGADLLLDDRQDKGPIKLTPYWSVLEDPGHQWSIEQVSSEEFKERFAAPRQDSDSLNFGFTDSAFWLRISLSNPHPEPVERLLEIPFPYLQHVELHRPSANGYSVTKTGQALPFASRPVSHRHFVFPLHVPAQSEATYYLRVASETTIDIPSRLWEPKEFNRQILFEYFAQALYFGMLLALGLYNFLLFVSLRDRTYFYYVLFASANALSMLSHSGIAYQFLWSDSPKWGTVSPMIGFASTCITLLLFERRLLATAETVPVLDRIMRAFLVLNVAQLFGFWLLPYRTMIAVGISLDAATMLLALTVGIAGKLRGQRSARFFLLAFSFLGFAAVLTACRSTGINGIPN